jgi:hypothetical protein
MAILYPGVRFQCTPVVSENPSLARSPSMYSLDLEISPKKGETYIISKDRTVKSFTNPERPIGWQIIENPQSTFGFQWCVTQVNFEPEDCMVFVLPCYSREAAIYEAKDDGEEEVTSGFSFPSLKT